MPKTFRGDTPVLGAYASSSCILAKPFIAGAQTPSLSNPKSHQKKVGVQAPTTLHDPDPPATFTPGNQKFPFFTSKFTFLFTQGLRFSHIIRAVTREAGEKEQDAWNPRLLWGL